MVSLKDILKEKKAIQCDGKVLAAVYKCVACIHVCMHMYVICICMYACMHVCMYVCTYSQPFHKHVPHSQSQRTVTKVTEHIKSESAAACPFMCP